MIKLRLTAAEVRRARRQLLTMAYIFTASSAPDAVPRVPGEGRASAGLCATASVCTRSSWTGSPWTSCRSRVLCLEYRCCGTCLYYCIIVLHINPIMYHKQLRNRSDLNLCLPPLACHSEARNTQGRGVKLELKKISLNSSYLSALNSYPKTGLYR